MFSVLRSDSDVEIKATRLPETPQLEVSGYRFSVVVADLHHQELRGIWKVITKKPWASKTYHFSDFPWRKNDTFSFNPPFKKGLISLRSSEISSYSTNEDRDCLIIPNIQSLFLSPESSIHHWWVTGINPYHRLSPIQPRSVHYQLNQ